VEKNSDINPTTKASALASISYENTSYRQNPLAGHCTVFKVWGC
jgi:hypothetical protein